ncbi:MAG: hypothetical protein GF411_01520 [Candidatus Lokiarchaeota archaeon]|nr:hypothetical protein [Candidatus Lokiarchaeota archaeon]
MRQHKQKTILSLVSVALFLVSMLAVGSNAAVPVPSYEYTTGVTTVQSQPAYEPYIPHSENGTYVSWNQDANSTSDEWSWENKNWLFGPSPRFEIYNSTGHLMQMDEYVNVEEWFTIKVIVPKNVFEDGELGKVELRGWYMTDNWGNFSADFTLGYEDFDFTWEPWSIWTNLYNYSLDNPYPTDPFMDLDVDNCKNYTDDNTYYVEFKTQFNQYAPLGLFQLDMMVFDEDWNSIGTYNYGSGYEFQGIAVGIPWEDAWSFSYGGSYTLQKIDQDGDTLYSVSRNTDFTMRFNITGEIDYAALIFDMPYSIETMVNDSGLHWETRTTTGGWVYNDTLDTYVWDDTVEVSYEEEVFGEYQRIDWVDIATFEDVQYYALEWYWNETTESSEAEVVLRNDTRKLNLYLIYNASTGNFETMTGYTAWVYPYDHYVEGVWDEEELVLQSLPDDFPILFELNDTACTTFEARGELVVDFVGHFTQAMPVTNQYTFYFEDRIMGIDGYQYCPNTGGDNAPMTWNEYQDAKEIAIETPVTIAKILNADGTSPTGWMFQTDKGENFLVKGRLQGGLQVANSIDGVRFSLEAHDGYWTEDESRYSHLTYEVTLDMLGNPTFTAFNKTEKYNYTYGTYWDYVYTNITGWHYEYNSATNTWDWAYGEYWEWQWTEIEDWHWQWWYYNQLEHEWQENYIPARSPEAAIPADFCQISSFNNWTDGGDLVVSFLVNMSETVADTSYWWDFSFMNNTWHEDYTQPWDYYDVLSWDREWVNSFEHNGEQIYVAPIENQLAYYNNTLCTNEGSDYLMGKEIPYIKIDGEILPIKVYENYDPSSGNTWEQFFFYDHWDPVNDRDYYYYELKNESKIYVTYDDVAYIYNVTTTTGDSFLTTMEQHLSWLHGSTKYIYWIDIDGVVHQGGIEYEKWNLQSFEFYDRVEVDRYNQNKFVRYGESSTLELSQWWWSSRDNTYYMTDTDGNLYEVEEVYDSVNYRYRYQTTIDGVLTYVSYPQYYYNVEYDGSERTLVLESWRVHRAWYTEIDGVEYEMPYDGANAEYYWDVERTESDGGLVPSLKFAKYQGTYYPVYNLTEWDTWIDISGTSFELDEYTNIPYTTANGTEIWDPVQIGRLGDIGTFDDSLTFNVIESIQYIPEYTDSDWPIYYNDTHEYLDLVTNSTDWLVEETNVFRVNEYNVNGTTFYSQMTYPESQFIDNVTYYYYKALNGTWINLTNWEQLPIVATHMAYAYRNSTTHDWVFDFNGETYEHEWYGYTVWTFRLVNASSSGDIFLNMERGTRALYNFTYEGANVTASANMESIKRLRQRWGYPMIYGPEPIDSTTNKNFNELIIGVPQWGMWGLQSWTTNPSNGALDLDGNLETTNDQYFVQEEYSSTDSWNHTWDRMSVNIDWDPNVTAYGDNMDIHSWMGLDTFTWTYEWNQSFYWYDATTFTQLNASEMDEVKAILLTEEGEPQPGYWDLSWMAENVTWADILAEAEANGWDWISSNEQSWTWLSFGVGQNYGTSYVVNDIEHWLGINMHYEYSGLMIWEDENENNQMDVFPDDPGSGELSHYLIPDSVTSVGFVTPGEAYGNTNDTDSIRLNLTDEVTWGVTFTEVNGTVFPYTLDGYWGWYDGVQAGSDLRTFDERPTKVSIDELSFLVHFQGHINETAGAMNNYADLKVDNYVGNWDVDRSGGRDNLINRSLALNYFAEVSMNDVYTVDANGTAATSDTTVSSETFNFATSGAKFAEMIMGGVAYDWGKNTSQRYDVLSYTTPMGTFQNSFQSDNGQSATGWSFSTNMFYVTIGFPEWGGYSVYQDPVFVGYSSASGSGQSGPITGVDFSSLSINPTIPTADDPVEIGVDISTELENVEVYLLYGDSRDESNWISVDMTNVYGSHWTGLIGPFPEDTQVFFKVVVIADGDSYASQVGSYIVGQGPVTVPTTTTTTTEPSAPIGDIPMDVIVLLGSAAIVVVIIALLASRRKK